MVMSFVTERNLGAANIEMSSPNGENVKTLSPFGDEMPKITIPGKNGGNFSG